MKHMLARITFLRDVPRAKVDGVKSGYAPHHKFDDVPFLASGFHTYPDNSLYMPGDSVVAVIAFPSWEHMKDALKVGDRFDVRELADVVATGTILELEEGR